MRKEEQKICMTVLRRRMRMKEVDNGMYDAMVKIADKMDKILCSYSGRSHKSVYLDIDSLVLFVSLLMCSEINMQEYLYVYDPDIYEDETAVNIYQNLTPQTRWRTGCHTQIEPIRMNALKQFTDMGIPVYDDYVYYSDAESVIECGEILPYEIIRLFTSKEKLNKLYVFPYPYRGKDEKSSYYSFEPTDKARDEMQKYTEHIYDKLRGIAEKDSLF